MSIDDTRSNDALPRTYFVPRGAALVRETARSVDDLRRLRAELELLRRIRRRASAQLQWYRRLPVPPAKTDRFTPKEREELCEILRNALHPILEDMIATLDREFGDTRKEIMMSVINEEAENIVQDATDAGVIDSADFEGTANSEPGNAMDIDFTGGPDVTSAKDADTGAIEALEAWSSIVGDTSTDPNSHNELPPGMDEALAEAEAALARTVNPRGVPADTPEDGVSMGSEDGSPAPPESGPKAAGSPGELEAAENAWAAADSATPVMDTVADYPRGAAAPSTTPMDNCVPLGEPQIGPATTIPRLETPLATGCAETAVAEIEKGIRSLATLLGSQISEQWQHARDTFAQADATRAKADEACREAQDMLEEIARVRGEARIARDDADIARREAKMMRDDARRAKERAETSAKGAELAADQAQREAQAAGCNGRNGE